MLPTLNNSVQAPEGNLQDPWQSELELMLQVQRNQHIIDRERDLNMFRSGSAPPTVEGSLNAVGSLFTSTDFGDINDISGASNGNNNGMLTDDEIRSHPAYLSYYYSHENINPRLPPPLLSKEDWRVTQRFQVGGSSFGGIEELRKKKLFDESDNSSLFSLQPGLSVQKAENDLLELRNSGTRNLSRQVSAEWVNRGSDSLIGSSSTGLGARRKSFADIFQEGLDRPATLSGHLSRPSSCNAFGDGVEKTSLSDPDSVRLCNGVESVERLHSGTPPPGFVGVQSQVTTASHSFPSAVGASLSRSTTPETHLVGRAPGSGLPPVGSRVGFVEKKNASNVNGQNGHSSSMSDLTDVAARLSGLNLAKGRFADENNHMQSQIKLNLDNQSDFLLNMSNGHKHNPLQQLTESSSAENLSFSPNYINLARKNGIALNFTSSKVGSNRQVNIPKRTSSSANLRLPGLGHEEGSNVHHQNERMDVSGHLSGAYSVHQKVNSGVNDHLDTGSALTGTGNIQNLNMLGNQIGPYVHSPVLDPHYIQQLQRTPGYSRCPTASPNYPSQARDYFGTLNGDLDGLQKAYLEALLAQQKQQYELSLLGQSDGLNRGYHGYPSFGLGMPYPNNPMATSVRLSAASGAFQNERISRFTSMMRSSMGGSVGSWHSDIDINNVDGRFVSSLLDEFKNNKTRSFELSDIVGHVVEFSADQYGSRFIQQKLETASVEEKNVIFPEIIPHGRSLMTDVFGNYVIQKFFEHGTESQRTELASQLIGHVLPLSLQMYGCRVIQKALEVVDVDQQTQMVSELDGAVMKCVRDQNGNHVIQKCIECVPLNQIQFIISSFYGQVVPLSTHPYGCRVIQRVLEHCDDLNTQQIIMGEIMQSVCILAQDQYGNYVIQHVLEHGKPHERSAIIAKLAGNIIKMSRQKFASNVVEKCLTFGGPDERQLLVNEMLGSTDENEPLQAMMKDPFGNYVVQKVLETCDDQSLELILSRIKVHLNALKRYTYGKHIVSRVEKLIATGERRIGMLASYSS
ncbi:pumilio homolog 4 [Tripterygium wilfordii]|uniref:pumilio homolog 4 n=1 Tax=Tripterygium wilfordii TaxID=458696 RepID=UPI0018F80AAD|nr:pumilio homolog 4 [Tripterygium wilfordii]